MKIAIVGSRDYDSLSDLVNMDIFIRKYIEIDDVEVVISGGAVGADSLAKLWCSTYKIEITEIIPDWNTYGKRAGMLRNRQIIENADIVFLFWNGRSKGTQHSLKITKELGKEYYLYIYD